MSGCVCERRENGEIDPHTCMHKNERRHREQMSCGEKTPKGEDGSWGKLRCCPKKSLANNSAALLGLCLHFGETAWSHCQNWRVRGREEHMLWRGVGQLLSYINYDPCARGKDPCPDFNDR